MAMAISELAWAGFGLIWPFTLTIMKCSPLRGELQAMPAPITPHIAPRVDGSCDVGR